MDDFTRYLDEMLHGPLGFRFMVQPILATLVGVWHGRKDSHTGQGPFLLGIAKAHGIDREKRKKSAMRAIVVPIGVAIVLSCIAQYLIFTRVRLLPALSFALVFVAIPYALARALAERLDARWHARRDRPPAELT